MGRKYLHIRLAIWVLLACSTVWAGKRMTIEEALNLLVAGNPQWSPDGKLVAYTVSEWNKKDNNRLTHIYLVPAAGGESVRFTNGEKGESNPQWSPDGKYLAFTASRDKESKSSQIHLIRTQGGEAQPLTEAENGVTAFSWSPDGKQIAYITRDDYSDKKEREKRFKDRFDSVVVDQDLLYFHLWVIDVGTRKATRLTEGSFSVSDPQWSPDGTWIAYTRSNNHYQPSSYHDISADRNTDLWVVSSSSGKQTRQITKDAGQESNARWSPDGKTLAYIGTEDPKSWASKNDIWLVPSNGGTPRNLTADLPDSSGSDLMWSRDGRFLLYVNQSRIHSGLARITSQGGKPQILLSGPNVISNAELSADGGTLVFVMQNSRNSADLHVFPATGGSPRRLTQVNPGLAGFDLARSEVITWPGPQDLEIEGILTYPLDYQQGTRYPLILSIHGGPYGRFADNFDTRAQIFAANGYALLRPNPRGSTGYGYAFTVANVGQWGGDDFRDIMAGVDKAVALGVADADRCVVMGGSYGGFMTFWTITQTHRFKAAIGHAGISDWYSFHGQSDIPGLMEYGFTGTPWEVEPLYRKWSPVSYARNVKTPLLITHGEEDRRVPIAQAEQYYMALRKLGVEVLFLRYPREGHGITEPNHQIDLVKRQIEWFDRHLGIRRESTGPPGPTGPPSNK